MPMTDTLDAELAGIDALELPLAPTQSKASRIWGVVWPKVAAIGIALLAWQAVVWAELKPSYVLPGPGPVFARLFEELFTDDLLKAIGVTMSRAVIGFTIAIVIGGLLGIAVSRNKVLRAAIGSLITGLQTMPSIAWFPLAILLFKLSESAILFVVVIGAAPAIANGFVAGVDHIPPLLLRAGRVLGARGFSAYRHVIVPAALPSVVAGLKQGWAFSWRSLMAGELIVIIANRPSLGQNLQLARELSDSERLLATMIAILVIGILIDALAFGTAERRIRRRRGLLAA